MTQQNPQIAPRRALLATRAARWATRQVGQGRPVSDVAAELGCCWSAVNQSVLVWGRGLLDADVERIGATNAVGLDETLFCREGRYRRKEWRTGIVDVSGGKLLDIVAGRTAAAPAQWLLDQPQSWRDGVRWAALDLSGPYRATLDTALPHADQVADPFHVIRLANNTLDEVRRRVQNQTLRHRGREHDPLYRSRKLLLCAHETINTAAEAKLLNLLEAGDPHGEARNAWHR
ncbi:MAG: transposase [Acidimicrobiaceae bacterium]|nr:transposase [Acidimicrobiaceae bacterium]